MQFSYRSREAPNSLTMADECFPSESITPPMTKRAKGPADGLFDPVGEALLSVPDHTR
jgi:hypothetical protein